MFCLPLPPFHRTTAGIAQQLERFQELIFQ
jgi:hypothetical protein